jgi:hypothetical protein
MKDIIILGVMINKPTEGSASRFQSVITKYGCNIRTRIGLHDTDNVYAGETGLILLELTGNAEECSRLEIELKELDGIEIQKMIFSK